LTGKIGRTDVSVLTVRADDTPGRGSKGLRHGSVQAESVRTVLSAPSSQTTTSRRDCPAERTVPTCVWQPPGCCGNREISW
jgi:hypothetical protein